MTKSNAEQLRELLNIVDEGSTTKVNEAFGQPVGLLKQLSLSLASAFDPSKQWKLITGNYANQLYALWKKSAPPEATGEDLVGWFETNKSTGFGPGASDLNFKTLNYIVSKATNGDLNKVLTNDQLQTIFLQLSEAVARQLRGFTQKLMQQATKEQQDQVLMMLPALQKFIYARKNSITLKSIAYWIEDNVTGVVIGDVANAFKKWQTAMPRLSAASAVLPEPFTVANVRPLNAVELSAVLAILDEILLQVIMIKDQASATRETKALTTPGAAATPTPTPGGAPAAPTSPASTPAAPAKRSIPPVAPPSIPPSYDLSVLLADIGRQIKPDDYNALIGHLKSMGINVASSSAQQSIKKNPELDQPKQVTNTSTKHTSNDQITEQINHLLNNPSRGEFINLANALEMKGVNIKNNTIQVRNQPDDTFLMKLLDKSHAALYPGFGFLTNLGYFLSDEGRAFQENVGEYFDSVNSDNKHLISPAIVDVNTLKAIRKGKMGLPL